MTTLAQPKRLNLVDTIIPGKVGSVGDTNSTLRLAQSAPDLPMRFNPQLLSNPANGSFSTAQPYVSDSSWNMGRGEQTAYGLMQQDLRPADKLHEPTLGAIPQYQWRNKLATVYEAKRTGNKFLPLPGAYTLAPGEMARGGQVVRTTDIEGLYSPVQNQQKSPSVGLARDNDALFRKMQRNNSEKKNSSMSSPMVSNVPRASPVTRSGNVSLMDPSGSTATTPNMIVQTSSSSSSPSPSPSPIINPFYFFG
jgi:hypothetical protein